MKPKEPKHSPPMVLPASRIEKQKQTSAAGPIRKTAYETPGTAGNLKTRTQKRDPSCPRNFFIAAAANSLTAPLCKASNDT
jgi:hypothetical protein